MLKQFNVLEVLWSEMGIAMAYPRCSSICALGTISDSSHTLVYLIPSSTRQVDMLIISVSQQGHPSGGCQGQESSASCLGSPLCHVSPLMVSDPMCTRLRSRNEVGTPFKNTSKGVQIPLWGGPTLVSSIRLGRSFNRKRGKT